MAANGILVNARNPVRLVAHLDIDDAAVDQTIRAARGFFEQRQSA